jgi:acyl carrier protein
MSDLAFEVKELIIEALNLEDVTPADIDSEAPLFGEGLGLDSIDALEIAVALRKKYGVSVDSNTQDARQHFRSVRALTELIGKTRAS